MNDNYNMFETRLSQIPRRSTAIQTIRVYGFPNSIVYGGVVGGTVRVPNIFRRSTHQIYGQKLSRTRLKGCKKTSSRGERDNVLQVIDRRESDSGVKRGKREALNLLVQINR